MSGIVHFSVQYPVIIFHKLVCCITFFKGLQRKIKILVNANLNQNLYSFLYLNECYIKSNCNYSTVHLIYAERMTWNRDTNKATIQTLANNLTLPRYLKNIWYSAINWGRIVGRLVAQYSTRGRVDYLYFRPISPILYCIIFYSIFATTRFVHKNIRVWKEDSSNKTGKCCFVIDAARIWNQLPTEIKLPKTINQAKTMTKKYCKQLPTDHWILTLLILALWPKQCSPYFIYPLFTFLILKSNYT